MDSANSVHDLQSASRSGLICDSAFNSFSPGLIFNDVPRTPGNTPMLFTKLCPIVKIVKIRFSVSFLVSVELSSQED